MSLLKKYPPFSVLMSVYEKEKPDYFDLALRSIYEQTVKPDEIILVEDGPIPESLKNIVKKYQALYGKEKFKVIVSYKNQGLGVSLKLGTEFVSNEWIARMDSDDYSVPNRFENQLEAISKHPDVAVVGGQVKEFETEIGNIVSQRKVPVDEEAIHKFMKWRSPFNHPTVMINKTKLLEVGGYIPYGNLEDYYLWARMVANNYSVMNVPDYLVYMRADGGMYARRGKLKNLKYFYKLRGYLKQEKILSSSQAFCGDIMMTINIALPGFLRKKIYQNWLHK